MGAICPQNAPKFLGSGPRADLCGISPLHSDDEYLSLLDEALDHELPTPPRCRSLRPANTPALRPLAISVNSLPDGLREFEQSIPPGGSEIPGADAYATSKQCTLATALEFPRENRRLRVNAVEPGFNPGSSLHREARAFQRFMLKYVLTLFAPYVKYWSTPKRAARVITKVLISKSGATGLYYDETGDPMASSELVRDPKFTARVVSETRALLKTIQKW